MYNRKVLDIFKNPSNAGGLKGANGVGKLVDDKSGETTKIYLKIDENDVVEEAKFKAMGCVATIVSSSVLTDILPGMSVDEVLNLSCKDILDIVGDMPMEKMFFVENSIETAKLAVKDYLKKKEKEQKKLLNA